MKKQVGLKLTFTPERLVTEVWITIGAGGGGGGVCEKDCKTVSSSSCAHTLKHTLLVNNAAGAQQAIHMDHKRVLKTHTCTHIYLDFYTWEDCY